MNLFKYLSLGTKSLKYKLMIAFCLMSIVPLLILAYFVSNYIFPHTMADMFETSAIVLFTVWVSFAGYILIKEIITPVISLAIEAKIIAEGQYDTKILLKREDELGDIATAVNTMTGKMRSYIGELQEYSKKTADLNARVHRKVLTLTNLMRLGDLICSGAGFEEVAGFAAERMAGEVYGGFCAIFRKEKEGRYSPESFFNNSGRDIAAGTIESELYSIEKLLVKKESLLVDSRPAGEPWQKDLRDRLGKINVILVPMKLGGNIVGIIVLGNFADDIKFDSENVDVLMAFAKELVIGYQSSQALEKVKSLEIIDSLTGLYTFSYLKERLEEEISRAVYYQRPCSLIVVTMDDFQKYSDHYGALKTERVMKQVGRLLSEVMPPVGKVARLDQDEFGALLPEMNKRESLELAENIRKKIEEMKFSDAADDRITVSIGVGENPIDGANAEEILAKSRQYVARARQEGKNKVVGE
ncbi:MAG: diguanylate cyclase [Candidatus Omnitrophota bacterium]